MGDALAVVLDTNVFSDLFVTRPGAMRTRPLQVKEWERDLQGRRVVVAFQTKAELLFGALKAGWGEARMAWLRGALDSTPTIQADDAVIEAYALLRAECHRLGHALAGKSHSADLWIAAAAIAKGLPLLSSDRIFRGAPGLEQFSTSE